MSVANSITTAPGRPFKPGQSGNPSGRPKANPEVREALKAASVDAARKLVELLKSKNDKVAFQAAQEILNRTEGKPRECVQMEIAEDIQIRTQIRSLLLEGKMTRDNERAIEA